MNDEEVDKIFDRLNLAYTYKECEVLQPFHPELKQLKTLGKNYIYDPNVSKLNQCYIDSIAVDPEAGIKDMNRLIVNFEKGMKKGAGLFSTTFLMNDNILVKAPHSKNFKLMSLADIKGEMEYNGKKVGTKSRTEMIEYLEKKQQKRLEELNTDLKKEYIVGILLNKLKTFTPNFMQVYGNVRARLPIYDYEHSDSDKVVSVGVNSKTGLYLFVEFAQGISLNRMVQAWAISEDLHAIISCFLQVFYSLWIAQSVYKYVHGDLHSSNIIVIQLSEPVNIPYVLPNKDIVVLNTPYLVKIIDFGFGSMNVPESLVSKENKGKVLGVDAIFKGPYKGSRIGIDGFDTEEQPIGPQLTSPFFDLFKILLDMLKVINEVKKREASFYLFTVYTTLCDYIYFLQYYWDKNRMPKKTLDEDTPKTAYGALSKTELDKAKKLSCEGYYNYLNHVLFDYFKVQYLYVNKNEVGKGVINKGKWFTCNKYIIERLQQIKVNVDNDLQCWTLDEAKAYVHYSLTNVNMSVDYAMRHKLTKAQLYDTLPDIEKQTNDAYDYMEKQLSIKPSVKGNPNTDAMHEVLLKITVISLDYLYKTYQIGNRNKLDKGKIHFFMLH